MRRKTNTRRTGQSYIVAYDVAENRRRKRLADVLLDAGARIGLSLFRARLTHAEAVTLREEAARVINTSTDRVHVFRLCEHCAKQAVQVGAPWAGDTPDSSVVFV